MALKRYTPTGGPPEENEPPLTAECLHERYWNRIRYFAMGQIRDRSLAEDVAQETLRRTFEALRDQRVRDHAALPAFVFQTAKNICLQHFRSSRRESAAHGALARGAVESEDGSAIDSLIETERREVVRRALATLESRDRQLLTFLYVDGDDHATTAARLGIDPPALRVRKHRALTRLRAAISAIDATFSTRRQPVEEKT